MNDISAKEYFSGIHGTYPVMNLTGGNILLSGWFDLIEINDKMNVLIQDLSQELLWVIFLFQF